MGLSFFGIYKAIFRKRAAFVPNAPGIHFGNWYLVKLFSPCLFQNQGRLFFCHSRPSKEKVQLNHKIKPCTFTWIFISNCVIGEPTGTCLASLQFHWMTLPSKDICLSKLVQYYGSGHDNRKPKTVCSLVLVRTTKYINKCMPDICHNHHKSEFCQKLSQV